MAEEKKKRKPPRRKTTYQCRTLRMSIEEKTLLEAKAAEAGKSVNQFTLDAIKKARVMPKTEKNLELREQNIWLNRINGNLNMLAKHANIYKEESDAVLIQVRLMQIRRDLQTYIGGRA